MRRSGGYRRPKRIRGGPPDPAGILLVDKPQGMTSHDVIDRLRQHFGWSKVGHAGTLDPLATGVLIVLVGAATKTQRHFLNDDKAYRFTLQFGLETTTQDIDGEVLCEAERVDVTEADLLGALEPFRGDIEQLPPMVSAIKHKGKPLYSYARKGIEVEREPRAVTIHQLKLVRFEGIVAEFEVICSKGTYVRTLAHDIGQSLGVGACVTALRRTGSGPFGEDGLVALETLSACTAAQGGEHLLSISEALAAVGVEHSEDHRHP